ncbi:MAG: 16S rRNA (cytosine(1402)-N(4))-methyltransferase RsmH [Deltaproteobacteria bacterium]|nr:16S rRNA (cytosine(1402)-N(4))-methyltransferase RsmH [Deltaproteobacteria bacterium]
MRSVPHRPVLLENALEFLAPKPEGVYVDATVGAGGHARAIAERLGGGLLIGLDRDASALDLARRNLAALGARITLHHAAFSRLTEILDLLSIERVDGVLADLGVSSMQLDEPERGFSFRSDAPLDMRMDRTGGETAADLLKRLPERELANAIYEYGEERFSRRIARRIVEERRRGIEWTGRSLAELVAKAIPGSPRGRIDPATRTFQALRILVNREWEEIEKLLPAAIERCRPGGRIVVIAFHSLEDRIVKRRFRRWAGREADASGERGPARVRILTPKPVGPTDEERRENPRSRSARLRAVEVI